MVKVKNVYWMLAYAFDVLNEKGTQNIKTEEFDNIYNLFASILNKSISYQLKKGLNREYIVKNDILSNIKGKILISDSIKYNTIQNHKMICEYDDFSTNSYMNRIIKTTLNQLLKANDLSKKNKNSIKKLLLYFKDIELIDIDTIDWKRFKYNKNNLTYKMIMNVCYLVLKGLLITTEKGNNKLMTFLDDDRLFALYEKFVREYYRKHFPKLNPTASHIEWDISQDEGIGLLPQLITDTTLKYKDKTLIIDTKFYSSTLQKKYNTKKIISEHICQIFTYVKNSDKDNTGNVEGMLLYAKTDEELTPNQENTIGKNKIAIRTLDLTVDFENVSKQLDEIAYKFTNNEMKKIY